MSNQQDADACGAPKIGEAIKGSRFDYTCDDCMLPYNWLDYDQSPEYLKYYDNQSNQERSRQGKTNEETKPTMGDGSGIVF